MDYEKMYEILRKYDQLHLVNSYYAMNSVEKENFLKQLSLVDFKVLDTLKTPEKSRMRGRITPLTAMTLEQSKAKKEKLLAIGIEAIKTGKVGAVLLAGGMGTRLGSDDPKGMYNIGVTKNVYIFERIITNLMDVVKLTGSWIHLFVMTSEKNHVKTTKFFDEKNYFGYNKNYITFFMQEMTPAIDFNGKILMENKTTISMSPNGNGGWYSSMIRWNVVEKVKKAGIEYLNVFAVDNVLQRIVDPVFVGATIDADCVVGAKVVRKNAPDERVGVICREDEKPTIIEYYELIDELTKTLDENGELVHNFGVILNYLFRVKELDVIAREMLPVHVIEKKIPYIDDNGNTVKPEKSNGYKFETLVLDMIHLIDSCLPYEVARNYEFAPIKNLTGYDSVESARILLKENGVEL